MCNFAYTRAHARAQAVFHYYEFAANRKSAWEKRNMSFNGEGNTDAPIEKSGPFVVRRKLVP